MTICPGIEANAAPVAQVSLRQGRQWLLSDNRGSQNSKSELLVGFRAKEVPAASQDQIGPRGRKTALAVMCLQHLSPGAPTSHCARQTPGLMSNRPRACDPYRGKGPDSLGYPAGAPCRRGKQDAVRPIAAVLDVGKLRCDHGARSQSGRAPARQDRGQVRTSRRWPPSGAPMAHVRRSKGRSVHKQLIFLSLYYSAALSHRFCKPKVGGSNPSPGTILLRAGAPLRISRATCARSRMPSEASAKEGR